MQISELMGWLVREMKNHFIFTIDRYWNLCRKTWVSVLFSFMTSTVVHLVGEMLFEGMFVWMRKIYRWQRVFVQIYSQTLPVKQSSATFIARWLFLSECIKMEKKSIAVPYSAWSTLHCGWILEKCRKGESFLVAWWKNNMTEECKGWKI